MKKQANSKKLRLNRETVRRIGDEILRDAQGCIRETYTCLTCPSSPVVC